MTSIRIRSRNARDTAAKIRAARVGRVVVSLDAHRHTADRRSAGYVTVYADGCVADGFNAADDAEAMLARLCAKALGRYVREAGAS